MTSCLLFHDWEKWEEFVDEGTKILVGWPYPRDMRGKEVPYREIYQRRHCRRCGRKEMEILL